jgi:hypothetical protein
VQQKKKIKENKEYMQGKISTERIKRANSV